MFAWHYWWGLTAAQIDLGLMDQPFVDYKNGKDGKKHSRDEMNDLVAQWEKKRAANGGSMMNGWKSVKTDEILK